MSAPRLRRYLRNGMMPQLAVFEASVRLGSFTRAADELHLAQPTVSTQIRKLTEAIGQPLFEQVGRKMHVTPAGQVLYAGCQEILRTLVPRRRRASLELKGLQAGRSAARGRHDGGIPRDAVAGRLRASATPTSRSRWRSAITRGFSRAWRPTRTTCTCSRILRPSAKSCGNRSLPNSLVPIARADHPLARERSIPFARFAQEPFLLREPGSATRRIAWDLFVAHGLAPRIRMELSTNEAIVHAVEAGLGVSILSRHPYGFEDEPVADRGPRCRGIPHRPALAVRLSRRQAIVPGRPRVHGLRSRPCPRTGRNAVRQQGSVARSGSARSGLAERIDPDGYGDAPRSTGQGLR